MKMFEVEKDGKFYLIINAFHYLREGIGASDLLGIDYSDNMRLRLLTATECTFRGFKDDVSKELSGMQKGMDKPIVEHTTLSEET
jgi:hypothetical protein